MAYFRISKKKTIIWQHKVSVLIYRTILRTLHISHIYYQHVFAKRKLFITTKNALFLEFLNKYDVKTYYDHEFLTVHSAQF